MYLPPESVVAVYEVPSILTVIPSGDTFESRSLYKVTVPVIFESRVLPTLSGMVLLCVQFEKVKTISRGRVAKVLFHFGNECS